MLLWALDWLIVFAIIGISLIFSFMKVFLLRITLINSAALGFAAGIYCRLANVKFDAFFPFTIHPAICLLIGIAVFVLTYILQETKIGFWIFAVVFSIIWAFIGGFIAYEFTHDMVWFWVVFGLCFVINIGTHIRSRNYRIDVDATLEG